MSEERPKPPSMAGGIAQRRATAAPGPRPAAAAPAPSPAAPAPAAKPALDRETLTALRDRLAGADHFTVLGVKQDAPLAHIKAAYFQLAKTYHPDAIPPQASPEVKKLCVELFARVGEAWSVLGDERARADYLDSLRMGGGAGKLDVMGILDAENLFRTATLLVKARKYGEGLRTLEEAIRLNPQEPEFAMWKSWCEFLLAGDKRKVLASAAAAIEGALKRNPRCAQGYLFLGQMAKIVGDLALAERHLRRGLQVAPEHPDLQRELKYLRR